MFKNEERPPIAMSIEEYERNWKPHGWEILPGATRLTYRADQWGYWEAIRDLVQNALDETERYFIFRNSGPDEGITISDTGSGVAVKDFLLGEDPGKKKPEWARGRFGEGMKLALAVFLLKGHQVRIRTVGREIWPITYPVKVGPNEYARDILHFMWRTYPQRKGTEIKIYGYTGSLYEERFVMNLRSSVLSSVPAPIEGPIPRTNQILRPKEEGYIFCRDIYLKPINSDYSYNLWGFPLAPDRHGPESEDDLEVDLGREWCGVTNVAMMKDFLRMMTRPPIANRFETEHVDMNDWNMGSIPGRGYTKYAHLLEDYKSLWNKAWTEVFGRYAVLQCGWKSYSNWVTHLNYVEVEMQDSVTIVLATVIKTSERLVEESQEQLMAASDIPDHKLSPQQRAHIELARRIAQTFGVKLVYASLIPPASDNARTAGLYDSSLEAIKINVSELDHLARTLDTAIHEIAHHHAYRNALKRTGGDKLAAQLQCEDLTPWHADAMTEVAATVIQNTKEGLYDEYFAQAKL